jgi:hypothetical protein
MGETLRLKAKGSTMTPRAQGKEWAETWAFDASEGDTAQIRMSVAAKRLKAEHARAVRVVKQAARMELRKVLDTDTNEYLAGYQQATSDILTALQRGRGGKG